MTRRFLLLFCLAACAAVSWAVPALAGGDPDPAVERAGWLLGREARESWALTGLRLEQDEFGGGGAVELPKARGSRSGGMTGVHILASLVFPGSGEAMLGYKRGYLMMAADLLAWSQVIKNDQDGNDIQDEFFAYADEHWSEERLVMGYDPGSEDPERGGVGLDYFDYEPVYGPEDLGNLSLWVSREADEWEYYENLGKWDQFVFGWDDFQSPTTGEQLYDYEPTGTLADLRQPWTSKHRDYYREMRGESDDAFKARDRWLYVNIGLRIFSVLQTAYLEGLLGGGPARELKVAGHPIHIQAQPTGWARGALAASVDF